MSMCLRPIFVAPLVAAAAGHSEPEPQIPMIIHACARGTRFAPSTDVSSHRYLLR